MPTLAAMMIAGVAGWVFDRALGDVLGGPGMIANLILSTVIFYFSRNALVKLRDG
jgi:hypothetical protein